MKYLSALAVCVAYVALFGALASECVSPWWRTFWIALGVSIATVGGTQFPAKRGVSSLPAPPDPRQR